MECHVATAMIRVSHNPDRGSTIIYHNCGKVGHTRRPVPWEARQSRTQVVQRAEKHHAQKETTLKQQARRPAKILSSATSSAPGADEEKPTRKDSCENDFDWAFKFQIMNHAQEKAVQERRLAWCAEDGWRHLFCHSCQKCHHSSL